MDVFTSDQSSTTVEAGTTIVVMYCPPDRDVGRTTCTVDLKAHAQQFAKAYRARLTDGLPDLHHGHVGDAWAAELWTGGILEWVCGSEQPCAAHEDWMPVTVEHNCDFTLCIYPNGARLGGVGIAY
jgi:hypothetical protein